MTKSVKVPAKIESHHVGDGQYIVTKFVPTATVAVVKENGSWFARIPGKPVPFDLKRDAMEHAADYLNRAESQKIAA